MEAHRGVKKRTGYFLGVRLTRATAEPLTLATNTQASICMMVLPGSLTSYSKGTSFRCATMTGRARINPFHPPTHRLLCNRLPGLSRERKLELYTPTKLAHSYSLDEGLIGLLLRAWTSTAFLAIRWIWCARSASKGDQQPLRPFHLFNASRFEPAARHTAQGTTRFARIHV